MDRCCQDNGTTNFVDRYKTESGNEDMKTWMSVKLKLRGMIAHEQTIAPRTVIRTPELKNPLGRKN